MPEPALRSEEDPKGGILGIGADFVDVAAQVFRRFQSQRGDLLHCRQGDKAKYTRTIQLRPIVVQGVTIARGEVQCLDRLRIPSHDRLSRSFGIIQEAPRTGLQSPRVTGSPSFPLP